MLVLCDVACAVPIGDDCFEMFARSALRRAFVGAAVCALSCGRRDGHRDGASRAVPGWLACATPRRTPRPLPAALSPKLRRLERSCDAGDAAACLSFGRLLDAGEGGPSDSLRAAVVFLAACQSGEHDACTALAQLSFDGVGAPFDPACGAAILEGACSRGGASACSKLADRMDVGDLVPYDPARASSLRDAARGREVGADVRADAAGHTGSAWLACRDGDHAACLRAYFEHRSARHRDGRRADDAPASEMLRTLCVSGYAAGCRFLRAEEESAPTNGALMDLYRAGSAFAPEWKRSEENERTLELACREGEPEGCGPGSPLDAEVRSADAIRFACEHGSALDCWLVFAPDGPPTARAVALPAADDAATWSLLERACPPFATRRDGRDRDPRACTLVGRRLRVGHGVTRDTEAAAAIFSSACHATGLVPRGEGCEDLAAMADAGEGMPRDPALATSLIAGLCAAQDTRCGLLAARLEQGIGTPRDVLYAHHAWRLACHRGDTRACDRFQPDLDLGPGWMWWEDFE